MKKEALSSLSCPDAVLTSLDSEASGIVCQTVEILYLSLGAFAQKVQMSDFMIWAYISALVKGHVCDGSINVENTEIPEQCVHLFMHFKDNVKSHEEGKCTGLIHHSPKCS